MTPEQFLQLARVLPEPTCLVNDEGRVLAANPTAAELLGPPAATSQTILLTDLAAAEDEVRAYLRDCSRAEEMLPGTLRLRATDGGERFLHCEGAGVAPRSGDAPALVLLRFRVEEDAEATGRRFQMFMENLPGLAWM